MSSKQLPTLSKTQFVSGEQCEKRIWLERHDPDKAGELTEFERSLIEEGIEVGELAQEVFPGGMLIDQPHDQHQDAMEATQEAMDNPRVQAIYEAAFEYEGKPVRADVLRKLDDGSYELWEVKATSKVKDHHELDVAFQAYVLEEAGVDLKRVGVMHPDKEYVVQSEGFEPSEFFTRQDLTQRARDLRSEVSQKASQLRQTVGQDEMPDVEVGSHCRNPHRCPFHDFCHRKIDEQEHPITDIPYLSTKKLHQLKNAGILDVRDIPDDWDGLTEKQRLMVEVVQSGEPYWNEEGIREALEDVELPLHFVDFETVQPAVPVWPDTHPYEEIPFQWASYTLMEGGRRFPDGFISMEKTDPRPQFIENLWDRLDIGGSIFVYSSYEERQLENLIEKFPEHEEKLQKIIDRLVDLYPIVKQNIYHPDFHGSTSIKKVLPALVPGFDYSDLAIQDGGTASSAFLELVSPHTPFKRRLQISRSLERYCERDAEAMVHLLFEIAPFLEQRIEQSQKPYNFEPAARRRSWRERGTREDKESGRSR